MRERGFVVDAAGIVAGGDEELTGDVESDALQAEQGGSERGEQGLEVVVEFREG